MEEATTVILRINPFTRALFKKTELRRGKKVKCSVTTWKNESEKGLLEPSIERRRRGSEESGR